MNRRIEQALNAGRLLHDGSLDPADRVAGCLLLLYGQQLSRIAAITTGQVSRRDDAVFVRFGQHDVPVPEPLGAALPELIRNGRTHAGVGTPARTRWPFPGGLASPSPPPSSANACAPWESTPCPAAVPRSPTSPPGYPQPYSQTSCTSQRAPRSDGRTPP